MLPQDIAETGLELAKLAVLPPDVMDRARTVSYRLSELDLEGKLEVMFPLTACRQA